MTTKDIESRLVSYINDEVERNVIRRFITEMERRGFITISVTNISVKMFDRNMNVTVHPFTFIVRDWR